MLTIFENILICIVMGGLCLFSAVGFLCMTAVGIWATIKYFKEEREKDNAK